MGQLKSLTSAGRRCNSQATVAYACVHYPELLEKVQALTPYAYCCQLTQVDEEYFPFYGKTTGSEDFPHPRYSVDKDPTDSMITRRHSMFAFKMFVFYLYGIHKSKHNWKAFIVQL